jgi:phosphoglycolate phosphatase
VLILFDLDGTLTDPYEGITRCVAYALERLGLEPISERRRRTFIGPPLQDQFAALGLDDEGVQSAVGFYRERFTTRGLYENHLYDGITLALQRLDTASVTMAVATSKPTEFAQRIVEHFGLSEHFAFVAGASMDGHRRKKSDIIGHALAALDTSPSDAIMVGDRAHDIDGARAHRMHNIGVGWGYAEPGELEAAQADLIVTTPNELVAAILT